VHTSASKRALIVEDDRTFLGVLELVVTELGFDVTAVADGEAALRIVFSQNRPNSWSSTWGWPSWAALRLFVR
jgi:CheY-like chemotaxis protein